MMTVIIMMMTVMMDIIGAYSDRLCCCSSLFEFWGSFRFSLLSFVILFWLEINSVRGCVLSLPALGGSSLRRCGYLTRRTQTRDPWFSTFQATNIAETSITINGIRYVVDSGKVKVGVRTAWIPCCLPKCCCGDYDTPPDLRKQASLAAVLPKRELRGNLET